MKKRISSKQNQNLSEHFTEDQKSFWLKFRIILMSFLLVCFAGAVVVRAVRLQVLQKDELNEMAEAQQLKQIRLKPKRGVIHDRYGEELAVSAEVESIWANPRVIQKRVLSQPGTDLKSLASKLSRELDVDSSTIENRFSKDRFFVWLKRRVSPEQASLVQSLGIDGIHITHEPRRFYPHRTLASHILGFSNIDGDGLAGLERQYDVLLSGSKKVVPAVRDRRGKVVYSEHWFEENTDSGNHLTLTLDKTIQHAAERELALAVQTFEAQAGHVVVLDPQTGEILALANYPTFNPNSPNRSESANRRNRAITDRFEPGSTIKPFTVAAALAAQKLIPSQKIDCESGKMYFGKQVIHDTHAHEELTPAEILAYSSNIGTAKIAALLGKKGLYQSLRRFGFGEKTGVELPGETKGMVRHYKRWYDMDAATISFGQGMSVNALQMATSMAVIANGGKLMRPFIIKKVSDGFGRTIQETKPEVKRRVVPKYVARLVADMLTAVTESSGTGVEASIPGYLVAGKTGTAQKADFVKGGYAEGKWMSSFVGFVPAQNPKLVIGVSIDEPIVAHYGGTVAAPVFRRVGQFALHHLGVAPQGQKVSTVSEISSKRKTPVVVQDHKSIDLLEQKHSEGPSAFKAIPDVVDMPSRKAIRILKDAGFDPILNGSGKVQAQNPKSGNRALMGSSVWLNLGWEQARNQSTVSPPVNSADVD